MQSGVSVRRGMRRAVRRAWQLSWLIAPIVMACGSDPATTTGLGPPPVIADPSRLVILGGFPDTVVPIADTLKAYSTIAPVLELRDSLNHRVPMDSVPVTIAVVGGVAVGATTALTDGSGDARFGMVSVAALAGPHKIVFSAPGVDSLFHPVVFTAGDPTHMVALDTTTQTVPAGTAVPIKPGVKVTDEMGNPVPGVEVTFSVLQGGGQVTDGLQVTGDDGRAIIGDWTLGPDAGLNQLQAVAFVQGGWVSWVAMGTDVNPNVGSGQR